MKLTKFLAPILASTLAMSFLPAMAGSKMVVETESSEVSLVDLDLQDWTDAGKALERIEASARKVCRKLHENHVSSLSAKYKCRQDAIARAVDEINAPALEAQMQKR
ncbi:MAG: UrcA family protein [Pseudomonadota bacterium]